MAANEVIYRGSPHLNIGTPNYYQISNKVIASNIATISTSVPHGIMSPGALAVISGVDSTIDGTHIVSTIPSQLVDTLGPTTFTYSTTAGNIATTAVSPTGQLIWNSYYAGGTVTNVAVVNYHATITTGAAHGLSVGDIVAVETKLQSTLGARVLSVPTSTTFTYVSNTATVGNAATTGAWTKIPAAYIAPVNSSKKVNNIVINNRTVSNAIYSIYLGGYAIAENTSINGNSSHYIDLEQILFNGEKLIICASNCNITFHVSGENA